MVEGSSRNRFGLTKTFSRKESELLKARTQKSVFEKLTQQKKTIEIHVQTVVANNVKQVVKNCMKAW